MDDNGIKWEPLVGLAQDGEAGFDDVEEAIYNLEIAPEKVDPIFE